MRGSSPRATPTTRGPPAGPIETALAPGGRGRVSRQAGTQIDRAVVEAVGSWLIGERKLRPAWRASVIDSAPAREAVAASASGSSPAAVDVYAQRRLVTTKRSQAGSPTRTIWQSMRLAPGSGSIRARPT